MQPEILAAAYMLDCCVGDPEWMPHPVRLIGWSIDASERALRRRGSGAQFDFVAGAFLAIGISALSALSAYAVLKQARRTHRALGIFAEVWLASTCLATRNLLDEAAEVIRALEAGETARARLRLARIVGRDTDELDEGEISRAVVETLAESLSDGIVAPLFYLAIGGVPLAMAYKAVNTLDSTIGHKDERYFYFGKVAARMDDAANYIPARVSALLLCCAAGFIPLASARRGGQIWLRDGDKHDSPNAGQVEAAMAGVLGVRLGGTNRYANEAIESAHLGKEYPAPGRSAARRAWKTVALASLLGFGAALLLTRRRKDA